MKKISITQNDIERMVAECTMRILKEGISNEQYKDVVLEWDEVLGDDYEAIDYVNEELEELFNRDASDSELKVRIYYVSAEGSTNAGPDPDVYYYPEYRHFDFINPVLISYIQKNSALYSLLTDKVDSYLNDYTEEIIGELSENMPDDFNDMD